MPGEILFRWKFTVKLEISEKNKHHGYIQRGCLWKVGFLCSLFASFYFPGKINRKSYFGKKYLIEVWASLKSLKINKQQTKIMVKFGEAKR